MTTKLAGWAEIKGKSLKVSTQEVRALLQATRTVMEYHNIEPRSREVLTVKFVHQLDDLDANGEANYLTNTVSLLTTSDFDELATVVVHEMVHMHFPFHHSEAEKLTSTLTARIKGDVIAIANMLVANSQRRAAYIAHTKITYKPASADYYDMDQYHSDHAPSAGVKYRRNRMSEPSAFH